MPQIGPRGFRFSHLSEDHQKTVQWWMRSSGATIDDERCGGEVAAFTGCVENHHYDLALCKPEIRALKACTARMEADMVSVTGCALCTSHGHLWMTMVFRFNFRIPYTPAQNSKRNVERAVAGVRQDMRRVMLNKLKTHPLTWVRRSPLKNLLR